MAGKRKATETGNKTLEITVRLWTNGLADVEGEISPKHAWDRGTVQLDRNPAHGIIPASPRPFNSFAELPLAIEKALIEQGITVHIGPRGKKYLAGPRKR